MGAKLAAAIEDERHLRELLREAVTLEESSRRGPGGHADYQEWCRLMDAWLAKAKAALGE